MAFSRFVINTGTQESFGRDDLVAYYLVRGRGCGIDGSSLPQGFLLFLSCLFLSRSVRQIVSHFLLSRYPDFCMEGRECPMSGIVMVWTESYRMIAH